MVLVGRPNVGKSALFNRLIGRRQALVDATPGVTRDRLYAQAVWSGERIRVVDTGGFSFSRQALAAGVEAQAGRALEEADLILLVCDVKTGPLPLDWEMAAWIRRWGKPVLLAVNKVDHAGRAADAAEFSALGLGEPMPVSALHGEGAAELLEEAIRRLHLQEEEVGASAPQGVSHVGARRTPKAPAPVRVALIGRPNVGKSSLVNRLLQEERVLVDELPGTTRDPVEAVFRFGQREVLLIDTAGVRAMRKTRAAPDRVARLKSLEVIRRSDVCLGILDATAGLRREDLKLLDAVIAAGKPLCLAVNKWDLVHGVPAEEVRKGLWGRAPFLRFARVVCTSAKTGQRVLAALEAALGSAEEAARKVPPAEVRALFDALRREDSAPVGIRDGVWIRFWQAGVRPPVFHLMGRVRRPLRGSDAAYVERRIRQRWGFEGTPVRVHILQKRRGMR